MHNVYGNHEMNSELLNFHYIQDVINTWTQISKLDMENHKKFEKLLIQLYGIKFEYDNFDEKKTCQICGKSGCCYKQMNANSYLCWSCHMDLSN